MRGTIPAIAAAAFSAGLFIVVAPSAIPSVAAGPAEDGGLVETNIVTIDKFAAMWASPTRTGQGAVEAHRPIYDWGRKSVRTEGWPFCDPACQRGGRQADHALIVLTANRPAAKSTPTHSISVNRTNKSDRLRSAWSMRSGSRPIPLSESAPALPKQVPLGCDRAFSSVADPAHAHIYKRCIT